MQSSAQTPFRLRADIPAHSSDVRCVVSLPGGGFATGSRDLSVGIWNNQLERTQSLQCHENFITALHFASPSERFPLGVLCSGSMDKTICLWISPPAAPYHEFEIHRILVGHENSVSDLQSSNDSSLLVSSSWDTTVRIWSMDTGDCLHVIRLHKLAVWSAVFLDDGRIISGGGDKDIMLCDFAGTESQPLARHEDVVRRIRKVRLRGTFDVSLLTCSNDTTVKMWTLQRGPSDSVSFSVKTQWTGHQSFVYDVALANDESAVASCGEDKTVRVWSLPQGGGSSSSEDAASLYEQAIPHPAVVWSCCFLSNGDLLAGCSDGSIRVWTRRADAVASDDVQAAYQEHLSAQTIHAKELGVSGSGNVPTLQEGLSQPGAREGETRIVQNARGDGQEVYQWQNATQQWIKLGDVVTGPEGGTGGKIHFEGQMYDYVFDVELPSGGSGKLPYNAGDNPYMAAQKFVHKYDIDQMYLDQVAQFIIKNAQVVDLSGGSAEQQPERQQQQQFADPLTGSNRYIPGTGVTPWTRQQDQQAYQPFSEYAKERARLEAQQNGGSNQTQVVGVLPYRTVLVFGGGNFDGILKKLEEFNATLQSPEQLTQTELQDVRLAVHALRLTTTQTVRLSERELQAVWKIPLQWPMDKRFPGLDLIRLLLLQNSARPQWPSEQAVRDLVALSADSMAPEVVRTLALRSIANALGSRAHQTALATIFATGDQSNSWLRLLEESFSGDPTASASRFRMALAQTVLNFTVLCYSAQDKRAAHYAVLAVVALQNWHKEEDFNVLLRWMSALGTMLILDSNVRSIVQQHGPTTLQVVRSIQGEHREKTVRDLAEELSNLLSA